MIGHLPIKLAALAGIAFSAFSANAQTCGFDDYHQQQLNANPAFRSKLAAFEKFWQGQQELLMNTANRVVVTGTDTTYEIPVVFHVIHTGTAVGTQFNPTDVKIQNVLAYLNQTFAATWPGYATTATGGTNIPLRFVLAKRDPSCNATTGINRINGVTALGGALGTTYDTWGVDRSPTTNGTNGITDAQLKGIVQWNPSNYYNIWVVNKIDGWSGYVSGGGVVGYAQFAGGPSASDGTVIMEAFNDAGQNTLPHELGHAFNLYHTFQGGCVSVAGCATNGDLVCDTEPHDQPSVACPTGNNPCTGAPWGNANFNIMNYTTCVDRFSAGQNARVKAAIFSGRASLVQSLGGTTIGTESTYTTPVALSGCSTPVSGDPGNGNDMGPSYIKVADMQSFSNGYTLDGNQSYVNRTVASCGQAAVAPAHMTSGQSYPVNVGTGFAPENVRVYIDFNNNGSFNAATETAFTSAGVAGDSYREHTGNTIVIPSSGVVTNTPLRMRVISDWISSAAITPCTASLQYGQAEDFTVIITNSPLAVSVSHVTAAPAANGTSIDVKWNAATEKDVVLYEIERSADGKTFAGIGSQVAIGSSAYRFNDANPVMDALNFYRLKIVNTDKTINYSKVVSASITGQQTMTVALYPNPAKDVLNVSVSAAGKYRMLIRNGLGQVVYSRQPLVMAKDIAVSLSLKDAAFTAGIYYVEIAGTEGNVLHGKFVKH